MTSTAPAKPPNLFWTATEGRALIELGWFYGLRPLMKRLPKGDGHPVIALPGFIASDRSTGPMRSLLKDLNYQATGWEMGRNLVFNDERQDELTELLKRTYEKNGQKVSLIGWSLGGVFAREMAKNNPEWVRNVITLGSPISGNLGHTNANGIYNLINGKPSEEELEHFATVAEAPPVPCTSILTKSDGIVHWHGSLQNPGERNENIMLPASHCGLGVNPLVMYVLANRLAQTEGDWAPFEPKGINKLLFKNPV